VRGPSGPEAEQRRFPDELGGGVDLARRALFARAMIANPRQVGAIWPTSRRAVRGLLDMADIGGARTVLEFGVGTGVYTAEILRRVGREARVLGFEVDARLCRAVCARLDDPRLELVNDSAENAGRYLGGEAADVIVSSLPFTTLPAGTREAILDLSCGVLDPTGSFLVLQYSPAVLGELERRFGRVRRRLCPLNLPPAFLFACEEPRTGGGG
jgi:phospholipid N-methyltransferase